MKHCFGPGFTLVEMMVVMAILGIIVVGVMGVIISQNTRYHSEEALIDMQLNASVAMDRLTREIRMAGFGCADGLKSAGMTIDSVAYQAALVPTTDSSTGWDQLTIISGLEQVALVKEDNLGNNIVKLTKFNDSSNNPYFSSTADDKKFCYISPAVTQTALLVSGISSSDGSITLNRSVNVFQDNTIYRVRAYTYSLRTNSGSVPSLVRKIEGNSQGRIEVAEGIEDLQFQFGWDSNNDGALDWVDTFSTSDADKVIAVRIILLAITMHPEKKTLKSEPFTDLHDDDPTTSGRQYIQADHTITYANDDGSPTSYPFGPHYHRQRLVSVVFVRNQSFQNPNFGF